MWAWLRSDIARLVDRVRVSSLEVRLSGLEADLRERMARFEGFIRREPPAPGAGTAGALANTFDTLTAARDLKAVGIEADQAEAIAAQLRAAAEADRGELVTHGELYRALWIQAAGLIGAQIAIAGFVVHLLSQ